jgi:replicative DNA helicase
MMQNEPLQPSSHEGEMSILGSILLDNPCMDDVQALIGPDDFFRQAHRVIYTAMLRLSDRSEPIDITTMADEMKKTGVLEESGGAAYLFALYDYVPTSANVAFHCKIVAAKSAERRLLKNAQEAIETVYSGKGISGAVLKLEMAIQPNSLSDSTYPVGMDQAMREMTERITRRMESKGELQGLSYGIDELDAVTSGMHPGELIIIAGRPSMGKSAWSGNILSEVCRSGKESMMFTLEMGRGDIVDRLAAAHGIKYGNIRNGRLEEVEQMKLFNAMAKMQKWPMFIDDTPGIALREVRAKARRQKKKGLHLVVIDYLQLMSMADPRMNRVQGIGEISRGLKQLARELEIPIILLSQLNRGVDSRPDKRPMMSDLRDSGEIEQDADVILFPYRPAAYCQQCRDKVNDQSHDLKEHQGKAEIIIEKQRSGERNLSIPVCWVGQYQRFDSMQACPW